MCVDSISFHKYASLFKPTLKIHTFLYIIVIELGGLKYVLV